MYEQIYNLTSMFFKCLKGNLMYEFLISKFNGKRGPKRQLSLEQIVALNIYRFHFKNGDLKNYHKIYSHKVTKGIAKRSKSTKGWWYGFKMSGICNEQAYDLQKAHDHEIELMKAEQKHLSELFSQTAEALASAIDAKDRYTHGHSTRVAEYSREIARRSGKSEKEVNEIFFAALLHDVGKIGVNDAMTSKRSYRNTMPQEVVRGEIEKGIGTQFDPNFAKIMLEMIDADTEYKMKE